MDRRMIILKEIYALHAQLVEVYHQNSDNKYLLSSFCKMFVELVNILNPLVTSKYFEYLFKPTASLTHKPELGAHLRAAAKYATLLTERIAANPEIAIGNEIVGVIFDYAKLLKATAMVYDLPADFFAGSRNQKVDAYTSFKIANQFFWDTKEIQRSNTLNGFTIFALRQALEAGAKELLGLKAIFNAQGQPDHYTTQLPWKFLVEFNNKPYLKLPFSPTELQIIYKWSNHFVHTGTDANCYVTALAIQTVEQLFQRIKIQSWPGQTEWVYANIITNKAAFRTDFTQYLAECHPPRYPEWRPNAPLAYFTG